MSKLKPFQLVLIFMCVFVGVAGLLIFAFLGPKPDKSPVIGPTVVVWGTLPQDSMDNAIRTVTDANSKKKTADRLPLNVKYVQKDPTTFHNDLLEAIAANNSPDAVLLSTDNIMENKSLIYTIPLANYPQRTFQDTFIDEGNLFGQSDGYFALPFAVDPLVLYYNKTLLTQANIINPPSYWDEVIAMVPKLTKYDQTSKISQSAIGLGEYRNITNSTSILSALLLQGGDPITTFNFINTSSGSSNQLKSVLFTNSSGSNILPPAVAALNFYTQFADPTKLSTYTWNRSLPVSQDYFSAGNLAMYIGFGSEIKTLENKNPNLNFDISFLPYERTSNAKYTFGKLYGLGIIKNSKNIGGAFQALTSLTSNEFQTTYIKNSGLPPVRRDLLGQVPTDVFSPVLYESSLKSKGWLQPDVVGTNSVFQNMVETVLSGQDLPSNSAQKAEDALQVLTEKIK